MNINNKLKRYIRGGVMVLRSLFIERPRGLDFSMRQKNHGIQTEGNHGYALTQEKAFDIILRQLELDENDCFIDIGCGKGGCLYYATKYGFNRIAGIEIEDSLYRIAVRNFQKLKMHHVEIYHEDAITFSRYDEFNVFYMFNPFEPEIYREVLDNLFKCFTQLRAKRKKIYLICYGASESAYIKSSGMFDLINEYTDEIRGTCVHIWKVKI
ncbi:MAG: class I SAM-dependent methyltransferase [Eubacterium sp.]|nr:class I SAM-dependent methyltransferase [Eubacterium sp.]